MALEEPSRKEAQEARKFIEELRKNPVKYDKWLNTVLDKALKGWRSKKTWKVATTTKRTKRS